MKIAKLSIFFSMVLVGSTILAGCFPYITGINSRRLCPFNSIALTANGGYPGATYAWAVNGQLLTSTASTAFYNGGGGNLHVSCTIYIPPCTPFPTGHICTFNAWISGASGQCQQLPKQAMGFTGDLNSEEDVKKLITSGKFHQVNVPQTDHGFTLINDGQEMSSFLVIGLDNTRVSVKYGTTIEVDGFEDLEAQETDIIVLSDQPFSIDAQSSFQESTKPANQPEPSSTEK